MKLKIQTTEKGKSYYKNLADSIEFPTGQLTTIFILSGCYEKTEFDLNLWIADHAPEWVITEFKSLVKRLYEAELIEVEEIN